MKFVEEFRRIFKEFNDVFKFLSIVGILIVMYLVGTAIYKNIAARGEIIAHICNDEWVMESIDLSKVTEAYEFDYGGVGGYNKIRVEPGRIAVIEADCPDKVCVNQGYITAGDLPIVCLPHELTITIESRVNEFDAVAGR